MCECLRFRRWLRLLLAARRCGTTNAGADGLRDKKESAFRYHSTGNDGRRRSVGLRGVLSQGVQRAESTCGLCLSRERASALHWLRNYAEKATGRRNRRRLATNDLIKGLGSQGSYSKDPESYIITITPKGNVKEIDS